jgi:hypothetical protein
MSCLNELHRLLHFIYVLSGSDPLTSPESFLWAYGCNVVESHSVLLKPTWTYGIQLWGTTSNSNIEILERFQSKVLQLIVDAWYVSNSAIHKNLQIPTANEEISRCSSLYAVRLRAHTNELIATLTEPPIHKRLRRYWPNDLLTSF